MFCLASASEDQPFRQPANPYRINSPTASIAVRGTEFSVIVEQTSETEVIVYDGLVEVASLTDPQDAVLVHPGSGVIVRPNHPIYFHSAKSRR